MNRIRAIIFILLLMTPLLSGAQTLDTVTLRQYFDVVLREHIKQEELRFSLTDKALQLQSTDLERRLEGLNQLRQEVVRDRDLYQRKDSSEARWEALNTWKSDISSRLTLVESRSVVWNAVIGVVFVFVQIGLGIWRRKGK